MQSLGEAPQTHSPRRGVSGWALLVPAQLHRDSYMPGASPECGENEVAT